MLVVDGQYSNNLAKVSGEVIGWLGMPFPSLPLDCHVVLGK